MSHLSEYHEHGSRMLLSFRAVFIPGPNRKGKYNTTATARRYMVPFDEPIVGMSWPAFVAPHRVGMVGESLFVHCQVLGVSDSKTLATRLFV